MNITKEEIKSAGLKHVEDVNGGNACYDSFVAGVEYMHQKLKQCNVSGALPANEDILKAIIKIKPEPLPNRWADDEHINLNYMAGFMTGVKWSYGQGNDR